MHKAFASKIYHFNEVPSLLQVHETHPLIEPEIRMDGFFDVPRLLLKTAMKMKELTCTFKSFSVFNSLILSSSLLFLLISIALYIPTLRHSSALNIYIF